MITDFEGFTHPRFAILAADYRQRAELEGLPSEMKVSYLQIAGHLDRAATWPLGEIVALYDELNSTENTPGSFARAMSAEQIEMYLDEMNGRTHFPN